jgi:hypothetical protein
MSRLARWSLSLIAIALVSAISIFETVVYMTLPRPKPEVPLTAGLSGEWATISTEFDRRVRSRFPMGSPESEMGAELQRQAFSRQDWTSSDDLEHEAMRREDFIPCRQAAYIYWRADSAGRIIAIRGLYREEGCL